MSARSFCRNPLVAASTPLTASGSVNLPGGEEFGELLVCVNVASVAGTTPSVQFFIETSPDSGVTWFPVAQSASITAAGLSTIAIGGGNGSPFGYTLRLRYAVAGTTPSIAATVWALGK